MICMARDFRNKTFQKTLRGYAPDEVNEYIAYVNDEYRKLEKRFSAAVKKIDELTKKSSAGSAEDEPDSAAESEKILAEAAAKAEAIIKAAEEEAEQVRAEAKSIRDSADEYRKCEKRKADEYTAAAVEARKKALAICESVVQFKDELFSEYSSHVEQLETIAAEADDFSRRIEEGADHHTEPAEPQKNPPRKGISSLAESLITASSNIAAGKIPDSDLPDEPDEPEEPDNLEEAEAVSQKEDLYIDLEEEFDDQLEQLEPEEPIENEEPEPDSHEPDDEQVKAQEPADSPDAEADNPPKPTEPAVEMEETDEDQIRKAQLDRFFGILNDDDLAPDSPDSNEPDSSAAPEADSPVGNDDDAAVIDEFINGVLSGDESVTRELDLGELIRLNRTPDEQQKQPEQMRKNSDIEDFNEGEFDADYIDVDSIISHGVVKKDLSLTDEFDIVFSDKNSKKSVDEIRRQPTITPRAPTKNPKKIIKKHTD